MPARTFGRTSDQDAERAQPPDDARLKRTTNLLETLTASGHFGARVLGVRITNRLLAKGFAGLLGLYTLMQSLGMGVEERA